MKKLKTIINNELRDNESIFIVRHSTMISRDWDGLMHEYDLNDIFKDYKETEIVVKYWHEEGLCIILK